MAAVDWCSAVLSLSLPGLSSQEASPFLQLSESFASYFASYILHLTYIASYFAWDDFASYFDSRCPSEEEYSSLSLFSAATLFTSLALNATKSSIPFGRIKRHPKAWWSAEVKEAVSERVRLSLPLTEVMKIVRLTSPLPEVLRLSSPRPRLRHGRRLALLSLAKV